MSPKKNAFWLFLKCQFCKELFGELHNGVVDLGRLHYPITELISKQEMVVTKIMITRDERWLSDDDISFFKLNKFFLFWTPKINDKNVWIWYSHCNGDCIKNLEKKKLLERERFPTSDLRPTALKHRRGRGRLSADSKSLHHRRREEVEEAIHPKG